LTIEEYDRRAESSMSNRRFADSRTVMPESPILILLDRPLTCPEASSVELARAGDRVILQLGPNSRHDEALQRRPEICPDPMILGLSLTRRAALAAQRAGYRVFLLTDNRHAAPGAAAIPDWSGLAATLTSSRTSPLIIAPAAILAETDWLDRLALVKIEPAVWATIPDRVVMLAAASAHDALAALDEDGGVRDLIAVEGRLARCFGAPASIRAGIDPMIVETPADVRVAERRLLPTLVKDTDGFMARHVERPVSLQISRRLARTSITPNQMSLISIAIGICGGPFFLSQRPSLQTIGALLFLAHSILDGCDGELARLKFQESRWGAVLDFWGDNVVHVVIFACMALGWSLSAVAAWPLLLGAAAVLGTLGSAGFVYWRLMRRKNDGGALFTSVSATPEHPLARLLDAASRRDFIYLVVILALIGKSNWFLLLAAVGAPIFFFLVVFLAARSPASDARLAGERQPGAAGGA
jgi:1L-myo-inositol 1-phosphate cytidylyltransferase / CDP-L-myo-inositol myo-inositolphosphotransferase